MIEDGASAEITREHVRLIKGAVRPRVAIFAAYNDTYKELADIARPNWLAYAERHNYALRFYPQGYHLDAAHPKSYGDKNRFDWYYDMRGFCEIVVYLDIDSLFVNMDYSVKDALYDRRAVTYNGQPMIEQTRPSARFLWTYGDGGPMSGLWIAHTDDRTEKHLRYAYEYAARENNVRNGVVEPNGISDQDSMTRLMHVPPFSETFGTCVDAEGLGFCYPDTQNTNPWIITCRGGGIEEKLRAMREWSARVQSSLSGQEAHHANAR